MTNLTDPNLTDSQDQNSTASIHDSLTELNKKSSGNEKRHSASFQPFTVTILNPAQGSIPSEIIKDAINRSGQLTAQGQQPTVIIYNTKDCGCPEKKEEDVTEEFVKEFNEHIGNKENHEKALRLLKKMQKLGGLVPNTPPAEIDIPSARVGLAILAGLKNYSLKMEALKNLQTILTHDPVTKDSAINLVFLSIMLLKRMDRELMQAEIIEVQIEIAKTYGAVAELLLHHYTKKHINAITKELKAQLSDSAKALEDLNRQEDPRLSYFVRFALEGMNRLIDDNKILLEILYRIYQATLSGAALYSQDFQGAQPTLNATFEDIHIYIKKSWFAGAVLLHELSKNIKKDRDSLLIFQSYLTQSYKDFNWRFLYEAIEILSDVAINGANQQIRQTAFEGIKAFHPPLLGVSSFNNFNEFKRKTDMSPVLHLKAPRKKNRNVIIREVCVENLIKIAKESPDKEVRTKAKQLLLDRLGSEKKIPILELIRNFVPKTPKEQLTWIEEKEKKTKRLSSGSTASVATLEKKTKKSRAKKTTNNPSPSQLHSPEIQAIAKNIIKPKNINLRQTQEIFKSNVSNIPNITLTSPSPTTSFEESEDQFEDVTSESDEQT